MNTNQAHTKKTDREAWKLLGQFFSFPKGGILIPVF